MADLPSCPICTLDDILIAADGYECATCGHEWDAEPDDGLGEIRDANGNLLSDGDDVVAVKDLKIDGKAGGIKVGTK
ncbi:MAG: PhnA domain-containing protein, partial [Acidimicrobiales bacterium]|nr:PhnA domain-containing protein [Acidimicrobiales bacterium]